MEKSLDRLVNYSWTYTMNAEWNHSGAHRFHLSYVQFSGTGAFALDTSLFLFLVRNDISRFSNVDSSNDSVVWVRCPPFCTQSSAFSIRHLLLMVATKESHSSQGTARCLKGTETLNLVLELILSLKHIAVQMLWICRFDAGKMKGKLQISKQGLQDMTDSLLAT